MAPRSSQRSVRIRAVDREITARDLDVLLQLQSGPPGVAGTSHGVVTSISVDGKHCTCTVTFSSDSAKQKALSRWTSGGPQTQKYVFDDLFDGTTILYSPVNIDIDVCAIHGLGGHAMDTFATPTTMWLRDLLSTTEPFQKARIMTFGYNSTLFEKSSMDRLQDWADYLLGSLEDLRQETAACNRPILFVCHSLGGIVARKAMIRLSNRPSKYKALKIKDCALLFLSTPHSGSTAADYGKFLTSVLEAVAGLRNDAIVAELKSFNSSSVDATEDFQYMKDQPPFECLCESLKTSVKGRDREASLLHSSVIRTMDANLSKIVSQASAGFLGKTADKVQNVDHHTICKFETKLSNGYPQALKRLKDLRIKLLGSGLVNQKQSAENRHPGHPTPTSYRAPLESHTKWYVGGFLKRSPGRFTGRNDLLDSISQAIQPGEISDSQRIIALSGVGGVGKTELLLEFAFRNRNRRNVFFCQAKATGGLEASINQIATLVGSEVLAYKHKLSERQTIWREMDTTDRVAALMEWLGEEANRSALFLVDDIDAAEDADTVLAVLPLGAHTILYTSRDPNILANTERDGQDLRVGGMGAEEAVLLMQRTLLGLRSVNPILSVSDESFYTIASLLHGHALAVCRAVQFMGQILTFKIDKPPDEQFLEMFTNQDWETRKAFLDFKPRPGRSIMEVFDVSLGRIRQEPSMTSRLLHIAAFLSGPGLDFRNFLFMKRPWISMLKNELPNFDLFTLDHATVMQCLGQLENTSSLSRRAPDGALILHPLWLECLRQRVRHPGRLLILRQLYLLARASIMMQEEVENIQQFLDNCYGIAYAFRISEDDITFSDKRLHELLSRPQEDNIPTVLASLLQECRTIDAALSQNQGFDTSEAFSKYLSQIVPVLQQFFAFEKAQDWSQSRERTIAAHVEVYDYLTRIVRGNAEFSARLPQHREQFMNKIASSRPYGGHAG